MKTGLNINSMQTTGLLRLFLTMFVDATDSCWRIILESGGSQPCSYSCQSENIRVIE